MTEIIEGIKSDFDLSIVVPATRMKGKLSNLESWLSDIWKFPFQVVIVHDVQDTETSLLLGELAKRMKHRRDQIILIEKTLGAPGLARNIGLEICTGEYILFSDADDFVILNNLEKALGIVKRDRCDIAIGSFVKKTWGKPSVSLNVNRVTDLRAMALFPGLWRVIFSRKAIGEKRFTSLRMGEDQLFILEVLSHSSHQCFIPIVIYEYYLEVPGQVTGNSEKRTEVIQALVQLTEMMQSMSTPPVYFYHFQAKLIASSLRNTSFNDIRRVMTACVIAFVRHPLHLVKAFFFLFQEHRRECI